MHLKSLFGAAALPLLFSCVETESPSGLSPGRQELEPYSPITREYWITTEVIQDWDMAPEGYSPMTGEAVESERRYLHKVMRYVATDSLGNRLPEPDWQGLSGPIIRATVGDSVLVHFTNAENAGMPLSIHPHNLMYHERYEGVWRADRPDDWPDAGTAGGTVQPGDRFTYRWKATEKSAGVGPYHSHSLKPAEEIGMGLIGTIVVDLPPDHPEYEAYDTTLALVFKTYLARIDADTTESDHHAGNECTEPLIPWNGACHPRDHVPESQWPENVVPGESRGGGPEVHTINGIAHSNLPMLRFRQGQKTRLVVFAMNEEGSQNHTAHFHGEMLREVSRPGYYKDVFDLPSAEARELVLEAENMGEWMLHCHVEHHAKEMMVMFAVTDSTGHMPEDRKNNEPGTLH